VFSSEKSRVSIDESRSNLDRKDDAIVSGSIVESSVRIEFVNGKRIPVDVSVEESYTLVSIIDSRVDQLSSTDDELISCSEDSVSAMIEDETSEMRVLGVI
jgi:hypothetical protein